MNFAPVMAKVRHVRIYECGLLKETYEKQVGKWVRSGEPSEELTTRTMMDIIISAYVCHNCNVKFTYDSVIEIYVHSTIRV